MCAEEERNIRAKRMEGDEQRKRIRKECRRKEKKESERNCF